MAVASYADVVVAIGRPISTETEQAQVEWWLTGVEMYITARLGDVSLLDQDTVKYVEVEAVAARVRRHGTTESSITVSVDDGSVTRRYENPIGADDILDQWWDLLSPSSAHSAFTINPYPQRRFCGWAER